MKTLRTVALAAACFTVFSAATPAEAAKTTVKMFLATPTGSGEEIGTVAFEDTDQGMKIQPRMMGLQEGTHGFHLYQHDTCAPQKKDGVDVPALAAGGPVTTDKGEPITLPNLYAHYDGASYGTEKAPNVTVADLYGHAVVLDALGPGYKHAPAPVGGAIRRIACGVVHGE